MIKSSERIKMSINRDTRVLYRIKSKDKYFLTNDKEKSTELLRVFETDIDGRFSMEGYLLGAIFAHDPYIIPELEKIDCTFEELNPHYFDRNPVVDGLLGQAVGDAFGVPVEFLSRKKVREIDLQDMVGCDSGIKFQSYWGDRIPAGAWSDDTSMTIAAMSSIIRQQGRIDHDDIMKQFLNWWEGAKYTSLDNFPFGLGATVDRAFRQYWKGVPASECGGKKFKDNGNGALMRMFPFSMYCILRGLTEKETMEIIRKAAAITHGHEINALGCYIYTLFLDECIRLKAPRMAFRYVINKWRISEYRQSFSDEAAEAYGLLFNEICRKDFDPDRIPESGYIVDSLTTAIYSILNTDNFEDAIKMAVSFGYDTDTNAAITGSIAGAMYGMDSIPERWLSALKKKEELIRLGEQFTCVCCDSPSGGAGLHL